MVQGAGSRVKLRSVGFSRISDTCFGYLSTKARISDSFRIVVSGSLHGAASFLSGGASVLANHASASASFNITPRTCRHHHIPSADGIILVIYQEERNLRIRVIYSLRIRNHSLRIRVLSSLRIRVGGASVLENHASASSSPITTPRTCRHHCIQSPCLFSSYTRILFVYEYFFVLEYSLCVRAFSSFMGILFVYEFVLYPVRI